MKKSSIFLVVLCILLAGSAFVLAFIPYVSELRAPAIEDTDVTDTSGDGTVTEPPNESEGGGNTVIPGETDEPEKTVLSIPFYLSITDPAQYGREMTITYTDGLGQEEVVHYETTEGCYEYPMDLSLDNVASDIRFEYEGGGVKVVLDDEVLFDGEGSYTLELEKLNASSALVVYGIYY